MINNFASADPSVSNVFFREFYLNILQDILFVLTDTEHKAGFKMQSIVLARMFMLVESGTIQTTLYTAGQAPEGTPNSEFLRKYIVDLLRGAFPHLQA